MIQKELYKKVIEYFQINMPVAENELQYKSPYQLAVAVILSAQCTDKRVNIITPGFFIKFPTSKSLSLASIDEIFQLIKSCSYPNNKSKNLLGMAQMLENVYKGKLPDDVVEMQKIPGIGRKTANVLASVLYHKPVIAVDTHVFRVSKRIGLTPNAKNPVDCEIVLTRNIPPEMRPNAHHWLILHGRYICIARKPKCIECGLTPICAYYKVLLKDKKE
jgi:endonuclease III